jgi:hypothetical protein
MSPELIKDSQLTDFDKHSISYMNRIGQEKRIGYLMKQSKLLKQWRKRFFVLEDQKVFYFESEKEYNQALASLSSSSSSKNNNNNNNKSLSSLVKSDKIFVLTGKCIAGYTTTEFCFSIANHETDDEWFLLAKSEKEMEDWMRFINAHIHVRYVIEHDLQGNDFWDQGDIAMSFWKVIYLVCYLI